MPDDVLAELNLPESPRDSDTALCVHHLERASARPERMFIQFHGGVYRSDDAGSELRSHYQVIRVDDSPKGKVDDSAAAPHLHSLGHNNIIGSGALLDSLRTTRTLR